MRAQAQSLFRLGGPLDRFLQGHPEHASAQALRLVHLGGYLSTPPVRRMEPDPGAAREGSPGNLPFSEAWDAFTEGLLQYFRSQAWSDRTLLETVVRSTPPLLVIPEEFRPQARALAGRVLPVVEDALMRWPSDATLWMAWSTWAEVYGASLIPLLSRVESSPIRPEGSWPPFPVLLRELQACEKSNRMDEARAMLGPWIERRLASSPPQLDTSAFTWGDQDRDELRRRYQRLIGASAEP